MKYRSLIAIIIAVILTGCNNEPEASFSFSPSDPLAGLTIEFTNTSINADSYAWDFGDGSLSSSKNASHIYDEAGTYTVQLTATGEDGSHSTIKQITVRPSVTGQWIKLFEISGNLFGGTMNLVQELDGSITGSFVFSDGSGYTTLEATSNINNYDIQIDWWLGTTYLMSFQGDVNAVYELMGGSFYAGGTLIGAWAAEKVSKKNVPAADDSQSEPAVDRMLDALMKK